MIIYIDVCPHDFKSCFDGDGRIVFESLIEKHVNPVFTDHRYKGFTQQTKTVMKTLIVSQLNRLLPNPLYCTVDDIDMEMKVEDNRVVAGTVEFVIQQPLLGILSSLSLSQPPRIEVVQNPAVVAPTITVNKN